MKSKTTAIWFVLAVALAAFIWIFQHYFQSAAGARPGLLAGLHAADVTEIQVIPGGAREITVVRTNGGWQLESPIAYPAQSAAVESLLGALEHLSPVRLGAADLHRKNADAEFGFDSPQYSLTVTAGDQQWQVRVGKATAPGDQVFLRVVGLDGVFVAGTAWLQLLPHSANDWRDTALVNATATYDWIIITNGTKVIELRRDATNHLWRMLRPLAARADGTRIATALQQLRAARVSQFVTDDPRADLAGYGLQPADLDVALGLGTNVSAAIHAGKSPADHYDQLYARRDDWSTVVTVPKDSLLPWFGDKNDFRDTHLLEPGLVPAEIDVRNAGGGFTLQRQGTNGWRVAGEKFPVSDAGVLDFLKLLGNLHVSEFVKDYNTAADLKNFGLAPPAREITLLAAAGDTNSVLAALQFGATETNGVLVKRADEDFVCALPLADYNRLPEHGWEFRDRHIWSFAATNVAQVTVSQNGRTRQLLRAGAGQWSLAEGSQGIIDPKAVEETLQQLANLDAVGWVGHDVAAPERYGFSTNSLQLTIKLKNGDEHSLRFGLELPQSQTALAEVTLADGRWAFVCPVIPFQMVAANLAIPSAAP